MRSVEENIEALSHAMLNEAKAEAEQIMADAKIKTDAIQQRAHDQVTAERSEILDRARQEAERLRSQVIATTQMKARTDELAHREVLLEKVFADSLQEMPSVEQWSDYNDIAVRLVREAIAQLKSKNAKIRADEHTQALLSAPVLEALSKELNVDLVIGPTLVRGTGVIVETADGHLQYDNTLETRLNRLQNALRSPVYRILIGEPL